MDKKLFTSEEDIASGVEAMSDALGDAIIPEDAQGAAELTQGLLGSRASETERKERAAKAFEASKDAWKELCPGKCK